MPEALEVSTDWVGMFSGRHTRVMPNTAVCPVCPLQLRACTKGTVKQRRQVRRVREELSEGLTFGGR